MTVETRGMVVVPDLSAVDLTALAKRDCGLSHLDAEYEIWDYWLTVGTQPISGRGKQFEVLIWKPELQPGQVVSGREAFNYLDKQGFRGHTGAFTAWVQQNSPSGYYISIPEDTACWWSNDDQLYAPCSIFDSVVRRLGRKQVASGFGPRYNFVGFREL